MINFKFAFLCLKNYLTVCFITFLNAILLIQLEEFY